jgi:hypothetical protein
MNSSGFRAVATRPGDINSGTPRELSVDQDMDFKTSE